MKKYRYVTTTREYMINDKRKGWHEDASYVASSKAVIFIFYKKIIYLKPSKSTIN